MEGPVNVHPGRVGWKKDYPKASKVSAPASINENIRLGEREGMIEEVEKRSHCLNIFMDYAHAV